MRTDLAALDLDVAQRTRMPFAAENSSAGWPVGESQDAYDDSGGSADIHSELRRDRNILVRRYDMISGLAPMACKGSGVQIPSAPQHLDRRSAPHLQGSGAPPLLASCHIRATSLASAVLAPFVLGRLDQLVQRRRDRASRPSTHGLPATSRTRADER